MAQSSNQRARKSEEAILSGIATRIREGATEEEVARTANKLAPWRTPEEQAIMIDFARVYVQRGQELQDLLARKLEARDYDGDSLPAAKSEFGMLEGVDEASSLRPRRSTVGGDVYITVDIWIPDAAEPGGGYHEYRTVVRNMPRGTTDLAFYMEIQALMDEWSRDYEFESVNMRWSIDFIRETNPNIFRN